MPERLCAECGLGKDDDRHYVWASGRTTPFHPFRPAEPEVASTKKVLIVDTATPLSRSVQKRFAAIKGESMPTFGAVAPDPKLVLSEPKARASDENINPSCVCGHTKFWHANFGQDACDQCECASFIESMKGARS